MKISVLLLTASVFLSAPAWADLEIIPKEQSATTEPASVDPEADQKVDPGCMPQVIKTHNEKGQIISMKIIYFCLTKSEPKK